MDTVGKWRLDTTHAVGGIAKKKAVVKQRAEIFCELMKRDVRPLKLYAAVASFAERGGRDYWLLHTEADPFKATESIRQEGGRTIREGTWVVKARWYRSTSDTQDRRAYELDPSASVHVPVCSLVQERELEFLRDRPGQGLTDKSHISVMSHNFSNVDK